MSGGYKNFAVVGAGVTGSFIVRQLSKDKAAGTINQVIVLTRQESKTTTDDDVKVTQVDYSDKESIKIALAGIDVVISTISPVALGLQLGIAEASKEAGVKLFVPSEFGGPTEGVKEGLFGTKSRVQDQLKSMGIPYALFYTGPHVDRLWGPFANLDLRSGQVSVGGNGNMPISFTSRPDIARYLSYVLTHLSAEQLSNRTFKIAGDTKSFNEIFKAYEAKTGKKLEVTYIPVFELDARLAANPQDFISFLHKLWATAGPFLQTDNHMYPDWKPSSVLDSFPVVALPS